MIQVKRILFDNDHDNQKWIVLEGYVEGYPQVTKRRTINRAALADGSLLLADEKAKLVADVEEYLRRDQYEVEKELENL